jgi:hypothetical protein
VKRREARDKEHEKVFSAAAATYRATELEVQLN